MADETTRCHHCGVEVRRFNWALGQRWEHSRYPHRPSDAYEFCRITTASPAQPVTRTTPEEQHDA